MSGVNPVVLSSHLSLILFHTSPMFCTAFVSFSHHAIGVVTFTVVVSPSLPSSSSSSVCVFGPCSTSFSVATQLQMVFSGLCVKLYQ